MNISPHPSQRLRGRLAFIVSASVLTLVWTVVLPWIGQRGPMREMIERNESMGIDPTAMFYTELEHMQYKDGQLHRKASVSY